MNYFNKFSDMVSKGVDKVKTTVQNMNMNNSNNNAYVQRGINSFDINTSSNYNSSTTKNTTSMAEFLNASKPGQELPIAKKEKPDDEFMKGFELMRCETVDTWTKCRLKIEDKEIDCKSIVTSYRFYSIPNFSGSTSMMKSLEGVKYEGLFPKNYFAIPLHMIDKCEKIVDSSNFKFSIVVVTKDFRKIELVFDYMQTDSFFNFLFNMIQTKEIGAYSTYAVSYNTNTNFKVNGWNIYDAQKEYERQGLVNLPNSLFRITSANQKYNLCDSYPKFLIVPNNISDHELTEASKFRTKNRLPVLSYYYDKNQATLWRSSQTKSGIRSVTNDFDQKLMHIMVNYGKEKKLTVFDCRSHIAALANKVKGAGHENTDSYANVSLIFCDIGNIHDARNDIAKVYSMLKSKEMEGKTSFYSAFESTGWPDFIYKIIKSSINVATKIKDGFNALVHCSDGWDRASQITAFSQFLIDPYFRTIEGYIVLIEKDFLSFGHQFRYRNGYFTKETSENQFSPIFLQFLDATHQLLVQYPMYFEFNMEFLLFLANNIYSGKYGTFLYNNERERDNANAKAKTMSVWTEILNDIEKYRNPLYNNKKAREFYFFIPDFPCSKIRLWEEFFCQYSLVNFTKSYDIYINRFTTTNKKNKNDKRVVSNIEIYNREIKNRSADIRKKNKEIDCLKNCLKDLIKHKFIDLSDPNLSKETVETITKIDNEIKGISQPPAVNDNNNKIVDINSVENKGENKKTNDQNATINTQLIQEKLKSNDKPQNNDDDFEEMKLD